jgi:hypothetical protein
MTPDGLIDMPARRVTFMPPDRDGCEDGLVRRRCRDPKPEARP